MNTENQEKLSQILIEFYDKMSSWEHAVVKESALSPAQMHAIEIIGQHENLRMKELAHKMGVTTGTLTVMIDRLEKNGLVMRRRHAKDRRSYVILLTNKGRMYFKEHHQHHLNLVQEITSSFSPDDIQMLYRLIKKLIDRF